MPNQSPTPPPVGVPPSRDSVPLDGTVCVSSIDRPEWPLVKVSIFTGAAFPVAAAMGDFHKFAAGPVEQGKGFGPAFDGSRFGAVGAVANQIAGQIIPQAVP